MARCFVAEPAASDHFKSRGDEKRGQRRAGSFAPLAEVPADKTVVLGLVSTKVKELEEVDYIKRRVAEAAQYVSMDHLCISPQCGFSGSVEGTELDESDQQAKTQLLKGLAQDLWGYEAPKA